MNNIVIDVDDVVDEYTALIVLAKTGIKYTAQCGGMGCTHPEAEGFVLPLAEFAQDFDDCSYGCWNLQYPEFEENRNNLAIDFNTYCRIKLKKYRWQHIDIQFDMSRINQLQEGWIPVLMSGKYLGIEFDNTQCIVHNGNCD